MLNRSVKQLLCCLQERQDSFSSADSAALLILSPHLTPHSHLHSHHKNNHSQFTDALFTRLAAAPRRSGDSQELVQEQEAYFTFDNLPDVFTEAPPTEERLQLLNMLGGGGGAGGGGAGAVSKSHLDNTLPDLVREAGYQFTSSLETCRSYLRQWVSSSEILSATVARIIGVMVRTHTGKTGTQLICIAVEHFYCYQVKLCAEII